jgi:hypothetical protein
MLQKYCCRNTEWTWRTASCANILAPDGSVRFELDEWQTLVFFHADCGPTVERLVHELSRYFDREGDDWKLLERKLLDIVNYLATELGIILLTDAPTSLPYHYEIPVSEQDLEEAARSKSEFGTTPKANND